MPSTKDTRKRHGSRIDLSHSSRSGLQRRDNYAENSNSYKKHKSMSKAARKSHHSPDHLNHDGDNNDINNNSSSDGTEDNIDREEIDSDDDPKANNNDGKSGEVSSNQKAILHKTTHESIRVEDHPVLPTHTSQRRSNMHSSNDNDDQDAATTDNKKMINLYSRVKTLEEKVSKIERDIMFGQIGGSRSSTKGFELKPTQACQIGITCRHTFFSSFKYFDRLCITKQGKQVYEHCLQKAGMTGQESDPTTLFYVIKKAVQRALGVKRAHVASAIRKDAKGMINISLSFQFVVAVLTLPSTC